MSKTIVAVVAAVVLGGGCSSSSATTPTGCVSFTPDGGTGSLVGLSCAIAWSCNSDSQHYALECNRAQEDNYSCVCSTDTSSIAKTIVVNAFICEGPNSLPAFSACGYDLQM
jgi:hypothetical protein